jgi:hypothetical protein
VCVCTGTSLGFAECGSLCENKCVCGHVHELLLSVLTMCEQSGLKRLSLGTLYSALYSNFFGPFLIKMFRF